MSEGYAKHSRPEEKKSGPVRKILKFIGAVLLIAVLLFAGLIGFLSATEYKPADSDEIAVEGEEKPVKYVFLTDAGIAYTPDAE
jgi:hypothetical protein